MRRAAWWRLAFVGTIAVVLWLALRPATGGADWFPQADKLRHASAFAVLWWLGWRTQWLRPVALALVLLAFGGAIELLQSLTPDREPSWLDLAADGVGLLLGWAWTAARERQAVEGSGQPHEHGRQLRR